MLTVTLLPPGHQNAARGERASRSTGLRSNPGVLPATPFVSTIRYHGIAAPPRISWLAVAISAALHAGLILGLSHRSPPPRHVAVDEAPTEMLVMPDLKDTEEDEIKELNEDELLDAPSVVVPMLADIPINVPIDATFTQLIDYTIPLKADPDAGKLVNIPANIQRGRPNDSQIKNLFNIADLDRRPEPVSQTPPTFPFEQKRLNDSGRVVVGFIIDTKGDVVLPYVVSSTHQGFESAALTAVVRWKFRPGYRAGRKVNTRVMQPIDFRIEDGGL